MNDPSVRAPRHGGVACAVGAAGSSGAVRMSEVPIDRKFGRQAFGADPAAYHAARPPYPDWVFESLCDKCGLAHGAATFEIGAGTGTATRRLLDLGANPFRPGDRITATATRDARLMFLGGAALEGPRYIWWNFVSSRLERIEAAKADWQAGRFGAVPGETEFIPLPDR